MIKFAVDLAGNRIFINNAIKDRVYYCEECKTRLIAKNQGFIKQHHYAHIPNEKDKIAQRKCQLRSEERTKNQMSDWHRNWQEKYPEHMREVVFTKDGQIFRTDIARKDYKEVIEFQHSAITAATFQARNDFYNSIGYKVIWLFDFDAISEKYQYIYPDNYDEWTKNFVREGQKVYAMDMGFYLAMFGKWKPQDNRKVAVCFMRTYGKYDFYSYVRVVTGSFENNLPMKLFVIEMKTQKFLRRIGLTHTYRT